jgi:hypothetical protein
MRDLDLDIVVDVDLDVDQRGTDNDLINVPKN